MNARKLFILPLLLSTVALSACDTGVQHMGTTEYGVRFRKLPTFMGGGLGSADSVAHPLQTVVVFPWETDEVRNLVIAVVRSEVRSYMNQLKTPEFRDDKKRNETVDEVLQAAQRHLGPLGIEVEAVNLKQYRFVRPLPDGGEDTRYQDRLREIQEMEQDIEGERSRIETVRAKKQKEYSEAESLYNARVSEAKGYKEQSVFQGDSYYTARSNEAKAILAEGNAEVAGLTKQISALSGKGGQAMLRLEVAKQLAKANPRFVAMNQGSGGAAVDLSKTDLNQLIGQLGIVEGLVGQPPRAQNNPEKSQKNETPAAQTQSAGN